jgi:hypothetical protein
VEYNLYVEGEEGREEVRGGGSGEEEVGEKRRGK